MKVSAIGIVSCVYAVIIIGGCSTPIMNLNHDLKLEASYSKVGTINVIPFEDKRSNKEKNANMVAMNALNPPVDKRRNESKYRTIFS